MGAWGTCLEIAPQGRIRISFQFESESAIGSSRAVAVMLGVGWVANLS